MANLKKLLKIFGFILVFSMLFEVLKVNIFAAENNSELIIAYSLHMQNIGWQSEKYDGDIAGDINKDLRAEAVKIDIKENNSILKDAVSYRAHVQNIGWQNYTSDGSVAGTVGKGLRMEAIEIKLNSPYAEKYDIYYRVNVENLGWLSWAENGETAGTIGLASKIKGIQIKLYEKNSTDKPVKNGVSCVTKDNLCKISYKTHVQSIGWTSEAQNKEVSGTIGKSLRMEAMEINSKVLLNSGGIEYCAHVQNIGWQNWVKTGQVTGTTGKSLRMEALKIKLTGNLERYYDIYYRTHIEHYGWLGWSKNGQSSGSEGLSLRIEAVQLCLLPKGSSALGSISNNFINSNNVAQSFVKNLSIASRTDQAVVVMGNGSSYATLTLHEKVNGLWKQILSTPARVGYNGLTNNKYEGDGKTPLGIYSFGTAFGKASNPGTRRQYVTLNNNYYWVDDPNSIYYNKMVDVSKVSKKWNSAEHLIDKQPMYKYAIAINYNQGCVKNRGSAIFLHCSSALNGSTGGCVSIPEDKLVFILKRLKSDALIGIYKN